MRRISPDAAELSRAIEILKSAKRPVIVAGGGVRYSGASQALTAFAETAGIPVAATQAGKSSLVESHPMYVGSLGVTGASAANNLAAKADEISTHHSEATLTAGYPGLWNYQFWHPGVHQTSKHLHGYWGGGDRLGGGTGQQLGTLRCCRVALLS